MLCHLLNKSWMERMIKRGIKGMYREGTISKENSKEDLSH